MACLLQPSVSTSIWRSALRLYGFGTQQPRPVWIFLPLGFQTAPLQVIHAEPGGVDPAALLSRRATKEQEPPPMGPSSAGYPSAGAAKPRFFASGSSEKLLTEVPQYP
jgi:hypothetical protein